MITTELYIGNTKVDCNEDVVFALNYWMADIRNPESRNTDFSKTITIPGTQENNKLFTHIYQIGVDSVFNPNNKADVILFNGGARTFRGYAQLKNIIRQYEGLISYEINLFGEVGDIFQDMGESYVDELDFSELNHSRTVPVITGSWANTSGYVDILLNNGQIDVVNNAYLTIQAKQMRSAIFVKTIWDKIFDTYGFQYNSTFISGNPFAHLIMPGIGDAPQRTATISGNIICDVASALGGQTHTVTVFVRRLANDGQIYMLLAQQQTSTASFFPVFYFNQDFFVDPTDQIYIEIYFESSDFSATCTVLDTSEWGAVYNDIIINGFSPGDFAAGKTGPQVIPQFTYTKIIFGDELYDPDNTYNPATSIHTVPDISIASQIPRIKQRDFVLGLIRMFNLYVASDPLDEKLLFILPRDEYYALGTEVDWSQKIDLSQQYTQQPMPFLNFKTYIMRYKPDTDFYNTLYLKSWGVNYGDKEINVDTDFQTEVNTIELPFSATPSVQSAVNGFVLPTVVRENPIDFPSGNTFVGNPRILYYAGLKPSNQWTLTDGSNFVTLNTYPFSSHLDDPILPQLDLLFDTPKQVYFYIIPNHYTANNLYNVYYSKFIDEITDKDSKLLTAFLYLTAMDIQEFDFKNTYYLLNHAFKVNKIIDFNPTTPALTKVELLKMKEGVAWVPGNITGMIIHGSGEQVAYLWISPQDAVYKLVQGVHWFYGGSVDSVYDLTGTVFPMSVVSPKDAVF